MLDKKLLEVLACPICKGELTYEEEKEILICGNCQVYYEIREGIPIMLPEEAKPLSELKTS